MSVAKQCKDRFEDIVALVMGELDPPAAQELQAHIAVCDKCRAAYDALMEEEREVRSCFEALAHSLGPIERAVFEEHPSRMRIGVSNKHFLERVKNMIVTHKRLSAAVAATLTALAAYMVLYVSLFSSPGSAYALDQTAHANARVTSYHVKVTPAPLDHMGEAWLELNPDGSLFRVRMAIFSPDDGPKESIVSRDKAEVWFKMKHSRVIFGDKPMIDKIFKELEATRAFYDPKLAFEQLQADEKAGKVQVETREPMEEGQPITLTVTPKNTPDKQMMFDVDPQTKLVERVFEMARKDDHWQVTQMREYLDYNKQFDPSVFQFAPPQGTLMVDRIKNKVGIEKGSLTNDEIATKVVKEFFEALIAGDYEKASPLYEGVPAEQLKKGLGHIKFLRIVEIGKPAPYALNHSLKVPVKVEMEGDGKTMTRQFTPYVRAEEEGRWTICGGI